MCSLKKFAFLLTAATPLLASPSAQGRPPAQAAPPPIDCVTAIQLEVPDEDQRFARRKLGDEWFSGCLGPAGRCIMTLYIPC